MRQTNETLQIVEPATTRSVAVIACTDPEIRQILVSVLKEFGLQPVLPEKMDDLGNLLGHEATVIVFTQTRFERGGYQEILRAAQRSGFKIPVIVCSEFYDKDLYMEAMARGAFDYLATPYRHEEVAWVVNNAVHRNPITVNGHVA
jgi:DNA-binding NtrC family response regulator